MEEKNSQNTNEIKEKQSVKYRLKKNLIHTLNQSRVIFTQIRKKVCMSQRHLFHRSIGHWQIR